MLEVCSDTKKVKLTFLHPRSPWNLFKYLEHCNIYNAGQAKALIFLIGQARYWKKWCTKHNTKILHFDCVYDDDVLNVAALAAIARPHN